MAGAKPTVAAPEVGIGMLGYAFMGKAHSNAFKKIPYMMYPPVAIPKLIAVCGRDGKAAAAAAERFGYEGYYTDWRKMLEDKRIQLFDNGGPNEPTPSRASRRRRPERTCSARSPWRVPPRRRRRCLTRS